MNLLAYALHRSISRPTDVARKKLWHNLYSEKYGSSSMSEVFRQSI